MDSNAVRIQSRSRGRSCSGIVRGGSQRGRGRGTRSARGVRGRGIPRLRGLRKVQSPAQPGAEKRSPSSNGRVPKRGKRGRGLRRPAKDSKSNVHNSAKSKSDAHEASKLNPEAIPFIPASPPCAKLYENFREVVDPKSQQWVFGRIESKDAYGYCLQLVKPDLRSLPFIWVPFSSTENPGTHLEGDPSKLYECWRQPGGPEAHRCASDIQGEPELPPGTAIIEVIDPKTYRWCFARIEEKTEHGFNVQLLKKHLRKLPYVWVPFRDVRKAGTNLHHDPSKVERCLFTMVTSRRKSGEPPDRGGFLGRFGEWYEYVCGQCGDHFPSERELKADGLVQCPACCKLHHYGGYGIKERPGEGWPVQTCIICNRLYPSSVPYGGKNARCLTCRSDHDESRYADSPCILCGVVHKSTECMQGIGGESYLNWVMAKISSTSS